MIIVNYQPSIEARRALGGSPFRLAGGRELTGVAQMADPQLHVLRRPPAPAFAAVSRLISPPIVRANEIIHRKRQLPIVRATGRVITQQEVEDACDD